MKSPGRWCWMGALGLIVLIGGGWWLIGRNREPRYEGTTVEQWFKTYYTETDQRESADALRALRTNALPYLVGVAFSANQDSAFHTKLSELFDRLPNSWPKPRFIFADRIRHNSISAIYEIDPSCQELMPLLKGTLEQTNSPQHVTALYLLGFITNEQEIVVSRLIEALHEPDPEAQRAVYHYIADTGTNMEVADLVRFFQLSQSGSRIWSESAKTLGLIGSNAIPAMPLLKTAFGNETGWQNRALLAACLSRIDPEPFYAREYLENLLTNNPSSAQIRFAADNLAEAGLAEKWFIPILLNALIATNCDRDDVSDVLESLKKLEAPDQQVANSLLQRFDAGSLQFKAETLPLVGTNAERVLDGLITNHNANELWAIRSLAIWGTAASIPILQEELNSTNKDISNAAAYSMQMISHL
jgi:HEAT repeat protein